MSVPRNTNQNQNVYVINFVLTRYITRDELRKDMAEYGMGDEATITEVLNVDTDNVCPSFLEKFLSFSFLTQTNHSTNCFMHNALMSK